MEQLARIENVFLSQRDVLEGAGRRVVMEAATRVRGAGGKVGGEEVVLGNPAAQIVSAAESLGCDCIVMGRRGLGDIGGVFMGSVSDKVGQLTDKTLITTE